VDRPFSGASWPALNTKRQRMDEWFGFVWIDGAGWERSTDGYSDLGADDANEVPRADTDLASALERNCVLKGNLA
jgi:hypothetical protein